MRLSSALALSLSSLMLAACVSAAITAAGVGGGVVITHELSGMTYRTFAEPLPAVSEATVAALRRMEIRTGTPDQTESWEQILAQAGDRTIEIQLEVLTPGTTRMRVIVRKGGGLLTDAATAVEIINQTEKMLPAR